MAFTVRQAGWPSLIATSRTPKARSKPAVRWFSDHGQGHLANGQPAGSDGSQPQAAKVDRGLVALVVLTASAVAWVAVWWVPVYLALMVLIFVAPRRRRSPTLSAQSGQHSANLGSPDPATVLRLDRAADGDTVPEAVDWAAAQPVAEAISDLADTGTDSTSAGPTKPRRNRGRARKLAKPAAEQVLTSPPATWVRLGPGKFVRVDARVEAVDRIETDEPVPANAVTEQERFPSQTLEEASAFTGIAQLPEESVRRSVTEEYGITPSTFGLTPPVPDPVAEPEDNDFTAALAPIANSTDVTHFDVDTSRQPTSGGRQGRRGLFSARHVRRDSDRRKTAFRDGGFTSSRRNARTGPGTQAPVRYSFALNARVRQSAFRAFGRISHIERAPRPRSPPLMRGSR